MWGMGQLARELLVGFPLVTLQIPSVDAGKVSIALDVITNHSFGVILRTTLEDTTHLWVSMRTGVKDAEKAKGYEPIILFHPTAGEIVRPVTTPMAYGHLMFPKEEDRVSIDAVQSGHATPESLGGFTPYQTWDSTKNYEQIAAMRDGFTGPVLDLENHYEGAHANLDANQPMIWNASQIRTGLYNGVYGGAAGYTLLVGDGSERKGIARWFSPRDGEYYNDAVVVVAANETRVDFTPPSSGSVDNDWLLVLEF
eukprot:jgi/Phyca11/20567/fgenesh1_pg.PHYCAscaffold_66_\